jgi:aspartate racemase
MTTPSTVGSRKRRATAPRRRAGARRDEKVVGVLGGMGPLATADFYAKLVRLTPARTDQDHLRVIIDSNPKIPDRTAGLEGKGPDPTPHLVATAQALERAGAEVIAMPCNSAHAYLPAIRHSVRTPVLDIMEEVAAAAAALTPRPRAIGLLATPGTVRARLYHRALASRGIAVVEPTAIEEEDVYAAINAVKAGDLGPAARARLHGVARALIRRGAAAIILGCTELPLVMSSQDVSVTLLDGTEILAAAALREALPPGRLTQEFSPPRRRSGPRTSSRKHHAGGSLPARRL